MIAYLPRLRRNPIPREADRAPLDPVGRRSWCDTVTAGPSAPSPAIAAPGGRRDSRRSTRTASSGTRTGTTLTLALDVVESAWKPEGDDDPEVPVLAFAERGKSPTVPGPMIGCRKDGIRISPFGIASTARSRLVACVPAYRMCSTLTIAAGQTRELRYRLDKPGSYFYWGAFGGSTLVDRLWKDSQLNGAIIVDPPADRRTTVFLVSEWFHPYDDDRPFEVVSVINGKAFPYTERLTLQQGDSTRFRILNTITLFHPNASARVLLPCARARLVGKGRTDRAGLAAAPQHRPAAARRDAHARVRADDARELAVSLPLLVHMDAEVTLSGSPRDSMSLGAAVTADHAASGGTTGCTGS